MWNIIAWHPSWLIIAPLPERVLREIQGTPEWSNQSCWNALYDYHNGNHTGRIDFSIWIPLYLQCLVQTIFSLVQMFVVDAESRSGSDAIQCSWAVVKDKCLNLNRFGKSSCMGSPRMLSSLLYTFSKARDQANICGFNMDWQEDKLVLTLWFCK